MIISAASITISGLVKVSKAIQIYRLINTALRLVFLLHYPIERFCPLI